MKLLIYANTIADQPSTDAWEDSAVPKDGVGMGNSEAHLDLNPSEDHPCKQEALQMFATQRKMAK